LTRSGRLKGVLIVTSDDRFIIIETAEGREPGENNQRNLQRFKKRPA
jgi:hypothetical protein